MPVPLLIRALGDGAQWRGMARLQSLLTSVGLMRAQASADHADPRRRALEKQPELAADLVLLAKARVWALCNGLLGKVPQRMLSAAHCDVLVMLKAAAPPHAGMPADQT